MKTQKKILWGLVIGFGVAATPGFRSANQTYLPTPNGSLTDLAIHPVDSSKLLVASEREVYILGGNKTWKRVLSFPGTSSPIRQLISHPELREEIFIVTEDGVLEGNLKTGQSKWIFRGEGLRQNRVYALALCPDDPRQLYLATERGLFVSGDAGKTWLRPFRWPENQPIELVAFLPSNPSLLLLGTKRELFFSRDKGEIFESGFSLSALVEESEMDSGDSSENEERPAVVPRFTSLVFSSKNPSQLWVGTSEGVFESQDGGVVWQKLSSRGLEDPRIRDLVFSERSGLVAATSHGIARFHPAQKRWESLPVGLTQSPATLALDPDSKKGEALLIASGNEILEWILDPVELPGAKPVFIPSPDRLELFRRLLNQEPTVREIQKAAIHYGDLGNGKIKRWHGGSRLRALIPSVSFGKKFSAGNNIDIDRGGTNNPDVFIAGPEKVDRSWDLGVRWELGDLLFSTAQTSIDSRAKLLVELRESILSEVTRIYFERRRVQMEIAFSGAEKNSQEYFDLLLRLDELTAQLDALTNGFLSRKLEKIYEREPELEDLWGAVEA